MIGFRKAEPHDRWRANLRKRGTYKDASAINAMVDMSDNRRF
jgi:hypothetical protein